jgi:hypothetical protein
MRRFAFALCSLAFVPACSAIVNPDTTRLGPTDTDTGVGTVDGGGVRDSGASCATGCDDGVACTVDSCVANACQHQPSDAMCGTGMHCSVSVGCVPNMAGMCTSDAQCSDNDACNGVETCHPGATGANAMGCVMGTALSCDDHIACTTDACAPATGCTHAANDALCNAGCFTGATCQVGTGCVGGTSMVCQPDGNGCTSDPTMCDAASGMCLHPPRDDDGDGYPTAMANGMPCPGGTDCNDDPTMGGAAIHPGATEVCNGIDDDCDMTIDEGGVCTTGEPDNCSTEQAITLMRGTLPAHYSGSVSGSTQGATDDYRSSCSDTMTGTAPPNGAGDLVYYVDVPSTGTATPLDVTISTNNPGTNYDTVLAGVVGNCSGPGFAATTTMGNMARCNDDVSTTMNNHTSTITMCVPPSAAGSARIHVLVDGYMQHDEGNFDLTVTVTPHVGATCP